MKNAIWSYSPVDRNVAARGGCAALNISDLQFLEWYVKKLTMHEDKAPLTVIKNAVTNFQATEPLRINLQDTVMDLIREPADLARNDVGTKNPVKAKKKTKFVPMETNLRNRSMNADVDFMNRTLQAVMAKIEQSKPPDDSEEDDKDLPEINEEALNEFLRYMKNPLDSPEDEVSLRSILEEKDEKIKQEWVDEIARETYSLMVQSGALEEVSEEWLQQYKGMYDEIGTHTVYKNKWRADGTFDKKKARSALRGDELERKYRKRGEVLLADHLHVHLYGSPSDCGVFKNEESNNGCNIRLPPNKVS
jgi:hypothetical protein